MLQRVLMYINETTLDGNGREQDESFIWSQRIADSVMRRNPLLQEKWAYEHGVILKGLKSVWLKTGESKYFDYIKKNLDLFITADGRIKTYRPEMYNLDHLNNGKLLFLLYRQTGDDRYRQAACLLRSQLQSQPRTNAGGFWHKQIYPHQMWLDGLYMATPFYAEFAKEYHEPEAFDDIALQFKVIERQAKDSKTGLFYHGWDESKTQSWANPETGCSPNFWGRAMGWFVMALVDVLDYFPKEHQERAELLHIFRDCIAALTAVQDEATGVWYQVLDQKGRSGNYIEASASCMFLYAIAKGVGLGYLDVANLENARKAYRGIIKNFVSVDAAGLINLNGICGVAGLGGSPYRDGSYEYYINEPIQLNDCKGVGAFILACAEMENFITPMSKY
jgi:unsaturated rhamnogalacturonyl hydrolase